MYPTYIYVNDYERILYYKSFSNNLKFHKNKSDTNYRNY